MATKPVLLGLAAAAAAAAAAVLAGGPRWLVLVAGLGAIAVVLATLAAPRREAQAKPDEERDEDGLPARPAPVAEMLDGLVDPVLLVAGGRREDPASRRFVYANAAAKALFLLARREGILATAVRSPEILAIVDEALYGGATGEARYEPGGAQERIWRAHAAPLASGGGDGTLALLTFRDETDVRRTERTRADFLANASHELRTPLASLTGFIETLRGHARDDAGAREKFLAIMHGQARRMGRLIDDLLSLSRIELNEHVPPVGEADLAAAAGDAVEGLAPLAQEKGVAFRIQSPPQGAPVAGDRDQVLQVVQNLAENALKYSAPGGEIAIDVAAGLSAAEAAQPRSEDAAHMVLLMPDHALGQTYAAVRVRDFGPGIAREHLPRLTERFYRVEGQKSGETSGTGLGLAIVKHIVNRHRGGLTVESAEGQGAAFTAFFPSRPD